MNVAPVSGVGRRRKDIRNICRIVLKGDEAYPEMKFGLQEKAGIGNVSGVEQRISRVK